MEPTDERPDPAKKRSVKRQGTTDEENTPASNDASSAKRSRGRPRKDPSRQPEQPNIEATTSAPMLGGTSERPEPRSKDMSNSKMAPTKPQRLSRQKRTRSPSPGSGQSSAHEALTRGRAEKISNRRRTGMSTSTGHRGRSRKGSGRESVSTGSEVSSKRKKPSKSHRSRKGSDRRSVSVGSEAGRASKRRSKSRRSRRSRSSSSTTRSKRRRARSHTPSSRGSRHTKAKKPQSGFSSSRRRKP